MNKTLQVAITMGFLFGVVSTGIAGQGMKNDPGDANTPDKIQRSAPQGRNHFLVEAVQAPDQIN